MKKLSSRRGRKRKTHDEFLIEFETLVGNEYSLLSEYITAHDNIKIVHNECGYTYYVRADNFLRGQKCPRCVTKSIAKSHDQFISEVCNSIENEYEIISTYKHVNKKVKVRHITCGHVYEVTPHNFKKGRRCPRCKQSRGVKKAIDFLKLNKVNYTIEKFFKQCKHINMLPFDVFLIKYKILIEYDGEGHFKPFRFSKDEIKMLNKLKEVQINDKIKNQYCIDNNIPLIRIPYWEFNNIEYILKNVLKHYNLIESDNTYDKEIVYKYLVDEHWNHDIYLQWNNKENRDNPMKEFTLIK